MKHSAILSIDALKSEIEDSRYQISGRASRAAVSVYQSSRSDSLVKMSIEKCDVRTPVSRSRRTATGVSGEQAAPNTLACPKKGGTVLSSRCNKQWFIESAYPLRTAVPRNRYSNLECHRTTIELELFQLLAAKSPGPQEFIPQR